MGFADRYRNFALGLLAVVVVALCVLAMLPFLPAILWALVLSILTYPIYRKLAARLGKTKWLKNGRAETASAALTTALTLLIVAVPFLLIGFGLFLQVGRLSHGFVEAGGKTTVDGTLARLDEAIHPFAVRVGASRFSLVQFVHNDRSQILAGLRAPATKLAEEFGKIVFTLVAAVMTQFFMLRDGHRLQAPARELLPLPKDRADDLFREIAETAHAVFIGTVLVAIVQGVLMALAFWWAGLSSTLLLGVLTAILCLIPVLGAPAAYLPIGLYLFIQGDSANAAKVIVVGLLVSALDHVLRPFFVGDRTNLHPIAVFFAVLGGVELVGAVGVLAGPMLLTILLALIDVIRERIVAEKDKEVAPEVA